LVKTALVISIFSVLHFVSSSGEAKTEPEGFTVYFKDNYEASRELFLANIRPLQKNNPELEHQVIKIPTKTKEDLEIDTLYLPPKSGKKERLLILTSGIHGIEGFVGSALQNVFITENFWQLRDQNLGILIVHALNPYGFKFARRVSENNVDLNRNFDTSIDLFNLKNEAYRQVNLLLNPSVSAGSGFLDRIKFYVQCVKAILQYSMDGLRRAILKGQYEEPLGVFYGGTQFEPQKDLLEKEFLGKAVGYEQILLVDLHTGYGERGHLHLFSDRTPELDPEYLRKIFTGQELDFGQKKDFYEATGGLIVYAAKLFRNKFKSHSRYAGVVFEFGTLNSQKTLGSLDSLYRMVRENQNFHYGAQSQSESEEIHRLFREMFYPSAPEWRKAVILQFRETLTLALKNQKTLN
jgi:hypothetical protein